MPVNTMEDPVMDPNWGEKIVISGMSGLYPQCLNVKELSEVLYNKTNPIVSNTRWECDHPDVVHHLGPIPYDEIKKFDAQFFKIHYHLGQHIDPSCRKLLEQAYQAIYDAGISPAHVDNKKIAVFIGAGFSESEHSGCCEGEERRGLALLGGSKNMISNRISYWLNSKGPSVTMDQACSSSIAALELGIRAIQSGECEAAIVGGTHLCLQPETIMHYRRFGFLCEDGKTKCFDKDATGFARSEAINIIFLQKAKDAKRCYAEVVHAQSKFIALPKGETGPKYGFSRDTEDTADFLKKFYAEASVSPGTVKYVEAFGAALPDADKAELDAFDEVFCKERKDPLYVGSVSSNIGYTEGASGISSITKVLLGFSTGKLASNMHCASPRDDVASLKDGRIRIVTEHHPFEQSSYAAVNSLSFTGCNGHVLLRGFNKPKNPSRYKSSIPHLVLVSGRQETSVSKVFQDLKSRPVDPEEIALIHNIHETKQTGHLGRGFTILDTNEQNQTISLAEKIEYFDAVSRPLWFVYSGMGSQWAGMGTQLLRIPIFAAAIEKCRAVLEPKGVDLINIITSNDPKTFDNILHSFVGIAAIQIGLTDVLTELGIVPNKIIGHSVGELGCAYADGCLTAEEMILSAYSRGLVSIQNTLILGAMAAVGLGYKEVCKILPDEIEVACHNSSTSCTVSGPAAAVRQFVSDLASRGVFAKEVPCSNIAYHSRYIASLGSDLLKYLKEIITTPKLRTKKWLSTSVPEEKWNDPVALYNSPEYHTNNLLNSVLFEETALRIPPNAVLIEIAPHGLLQAILKRSLPVSCTNIPLTMRGHSNSIKYLLEAIGELYMTGYEPVVRNLYPKVEFPVSVGTPMLSHLVDWAHDDKWEIAAKTASEELVGSSSEFLISLYDDDYKYLRGRQLKGRNVYPFAAALIAVWDTFAVTKGVIKKQISVQFKDVRFYSQPLLSETRVKRILVSLQRGSGRFEVMNGKAQIISGFIMEAEEDEETYKFSDRFEPNKERIYSDDIYKLFELKDLKYMDEFQSIHNVNISLTDAQILWSGNWVTFLDGILQLSLLRHTSDNLSEVNFVKRIDIDVNNHLAEVISLDEGSKVINAYADEMENSIRCGGVYLKSIQLCDIPSNLIDAPTMSYLKFIPRFSKSSYDEPSLHSIYLQIVAENLNKEDINVVVIINNDNYKELSVLKYRSICEVSDHKINIKTTSRNNILNNEYLGDVDLVIVENLSIDDAMCQALHHALKQNAYIINKEKNNNVTTLRPSFLYRVVCGHSTKSGVMELICWRPLSSAAGTSVISIFSQSDLPLLYSTISGLSSGRNLIVFSSYPPLPKLKETIKKFRKETNRNISLIMVDSDKSLSQYLDQPNTELAFNVIKDDVVGGEYYLPINDTVVPAGGMKLECAVIGDFSSLHWVEVSESTESGVPVQVHYAGLSPVDAKRAAGILSINEGTGAFEFSGTVESNGTRVMGLVKDEAVKTRVRSNPNLLWPVPKHWSLEEAGTVPLAYCHAFYCLAIRSRLRPNMTIMIHNGTEALGQALISIALAYGCEVFTTVSSIGKKRFLRRLFPELSDDHIGSSRDDSFGHMVKYATKGKGCDIVICSVKGKLKDMTLECCGPSGFILDTSLIENHEDYNIGLEFMWGSKSYVTVDIMSLFSNEKNMKEIQSMLSDGIARGYVRPITRVTYAAQHAHDAYKLLADGRHTGSVVLDLKEAAATVTPRLNCSPELCHLLISDNDALGIQLAEKLISRGAKKLYLQWKNPSKVLEFKSRCWKKQDVEVYISYDDILDRDLASNMLQTFTQMGPAEGIYLVSNEDYAIKVENLFKHLISKPYNALLLYTAIVIVDNNREENSCNLKNEIKLVKIKLPKIKDFNYADLAKPNDHISVRSAVEAIEFALAAKEPPHLVKWSPQRISILENIAAAGKINIDLENKNIESTVTLQDLGLEPSRAAIVQAYLYYAHHVFLPEDAVLHLTIEEINDIIKDVSDTYIGQEKHGLYDFISHPDSIEIEASSDIALMPTLTIRRSTICTSDFDVKKTYLCIIPGLEGTQGRFGPLCERLKISALVFQPGCDKPNETIQEMAQRLVQLIPGGNKRKNFYLVGYEYGVLVAMEMAAILEEQGLTGTLFCIGGGPEDVLSTFNDKLKDFNTNEALQVALLRHILTLMTGVRPSDLEAVLSKDLTWEEKLEESIRLIRGRTSYSTQHTRQLINTTYARLTQLRNYTPPSHALRSELVLIRPNANSVCHKGQFLQRYSQKPPVEYDLQVSFGNMVKDPQCSSLINRHLDQDILEEFEKKNHCETYFLQQDFVKIAF